MRTESPTLQSLAEHGWAVNFRCRACGHNSSWTAASLVELFGPDTRLEDLDARLRCRDIYLWRHGRTEAWRTCLGSGVASIIAPDDALGPDGRTTIGEIYGVTYPPYSLEAVRAKRIREPTEPVREDWPNAITQESAPSPSGQGRKRGDNPCGWV